jgi:hypothetical protein
MKRTHKAIHLLINMKAFKGGISKETYKGNLKMLKAVL